MVAATKSMCILLSASRERGGCAQPHAILYGTPPCSICMLDRELSHCTVARARSRRLARALVGSGVRLLVRS